MSDPFYANVALLIHADGVNGSTTFTDSGPDARSITANGNAQISTAHSKFGGASGLFSTATVDYLQTPNHADFDFGSGDYTVEAFVRLTADSTGDVDGNRPASIVNTWGSGTSLNGWSFQLLGNTTTTGTQLAIDSWDTSSNGSLYRATIAGNLTKNTWHHLAVTRESGTTRMFLNGSPLTVALTTLGSGAVLNSNGNALRVGRTANTSYPLPFPGYIDEVRVTKGVARYTAAFTPPTAAFDNSDTDVCVASSLGPSTFGSPIAVYDQVALAQALGPATFGLPLAMYDYFLQATGLGPSDLGDILALPVHEASALQSTIFGTPYVTEDRIVQAIGLMSTKFGALKPPIRMLPPLASARHAHAAGLQSTQFGVPAAIM